MKNVTFKAFSCSKRVVLAFLLLLSLINTILVILSPEFSNQLRVSASPGTTIAIAPETLSANPGEYFTFNVTIFNVTKCYGWQFKLKWPIGLLEADEANITEGSFLSDWSPPSTVLVTKVFASYIDVASTFLGLHPGVNGSGILATVTLKVTGVGNATLELYDTKLLEAGTLVEIPHDTKDAVFYTTKPVARYMYTPHPDEHPGHPMVWETVTFNGSSSYDPDQPYKNQSGNGISSYLWDFGDNSTGTGMIADHVYSEPGSYTVTLNVTDDDTPKESSTINKPAIGDNVVINPGVAPIITAVSRHPITPNYDEIVTVSANITDNTAVEEALLSYTAGSTWHNLSMNRFGIVFNASIPAQPYETFVEYRIYANDTEGNWAASDLHSYTVEDYVAPETSLSYAPNYPASGEPVKIRANVTEPTNASGVDTVLLSYRVHSCTENLLQNPGFEDGLAWWSTSVGTANYITDSAHWKSGFYSAKGEESEQGSLGRLYQDVTALVTPGRQYRISGWIKTEGVIGFAVIALHYVGTSGWTPADGYVKEIGYVTGTADWTYFESETFTLPSMPADCVAAWFLFDFNDGKGRAWWDDVQLIEVNTGSWWNTTMMYNETSELYENTIPGQQRYDTIEYFVKATDVAGNVQITGFYSYFVVSADVNCDNIVDVFDLSIVGQAYGSFSGMPEFNPDADITRDGLVDARDLAIVTLHYGETDP